MQASEHTQVERQGRRGQQCKQATSNKLCPWTSYGPTHLCTHVDEVNDRLGCQQLPGVEDFNLTRRPVTQPHIIALTQPRQHLL